MPELATPQPYQLQLGEVQFQQPTGYRDFAAALGNLPNTIMGSYAQMRNLDMQQQQFNMQKQQFLQNQALRNSVLGGGGSSALSGVNPNWSVSLDANGGVSMHQKTGLEQELEQERLQRMQTEQAAKAQYLNALKEAGGTSSSATPSTGSTPLGMVTDYGQPNDPDLDTNSKNGIGAWENKLKPGSFAVSPDIESQFSAAGIKPQQPVALTLADGRTVTGTWDDRTAKDLTGRFDFYSPDGAHPLRDSKVVGFAPAGQTAQPTAQNNTADLPTPDQLANAPLSGVNPGVGLLDDSSNVRGFLANITPSSLSVSANGLPPAAQSSAPATGLAPVKLQLGSQPLAVDQDAAAVPPAAKVDSASIASPDASAQPKTMRDLWASQATGWKVAPGQTGSTPVLMRVNEFGQTQYMYPNSKIEAVGVDPTKTADAVYKATGKDPMSMTPDEFQSAAFRLSNPVSPETKKALAEANMNGANINPAGLTEDQIDAKLAQYNKDNGTLTDAQLKHMDTLRGQYARLPIYQSSQNVMDGFRNVLNAAQDSSGISDKTLIEEGQRVLNPGSGVRAMTIKMFGGSAGLLDKLTSGTYLKQLETGNILTPSQRQEYIGIIKKAYADRVNDMDKFAQNYTGIAKKGRVSAEDAGAYFDNPYKTAVTPESYSDAPAVQPSDGLKTLGQRPEVQSILTDATLSREQKIAKIKALATAQPAPTPAPTPAFAQ